MSEIPDFLLEHLRESVLGRVRLKLYSHISGREHYIPEDAAKERFLRDEFRKHPTSGRLFLVLLTQNYLRSAVFSELTKPRNLLDLIARLETDILDEGCVFEITECPAPLSNTIGAAIYREPLADGGFVYVISLFDDEGFPESLCGHVEFRVCSQSPEPLFSVFTGSDYDHYSQLNYTQCWYALLAAGILDYLANDPSSSLLTIEAAREAHLNEDNSLRPPYDAVFMQLARRVFLGVLTCARSTLRIAEIEPHSFDFCLSYPRDVVELEVKEIEKGRGIPMVVYWNGEKFMMSDDYSAFLAHRLLGSTEVPAVILGEFPRRLAIGEVISGGGELMPQVRIIKKPNYDSLSAPLRNWMVDANLNRRGNGNTATLSALLMVLSDVLSDPQTNEKAVHRLLAEYPLIIDVHGSGVMSEVRLGKDYRIDLVIQYELDSKRLALVELEHPNRRLFTRKGRLCAHITHAIHQVEDWLQWWREHPSEVPSGLDSSVPIEGLVVVGRSAQMSDDERTRLLHLNSTRHVKVVTYDELLDRIERLIQKLDELSD
jgi:hypothetical protein